MRQGYVPLCDVYSTFCCDELHLVQGYSIACYENVDCGVVCPVGTSFCEVMDCCARCTVPSAATLEMATVPPAKETNFSDEYRTSC
jgi:hypothetical protein